MEIDHLEARDYFIILVLNHGYYLDFREKLLLVAVDCKSSVGKLARLESL